MINSWDSVMVRAVARELQLRLTGARVRALLFDRTAKAVFLFMREATVEVRLGGRAPEVHWTGPVEPFPDSRPLPAEVVTVSAPPDERHLTLSMRRVRGSPKAHALHVELLPRRFNVIWTAAGAIEAVLRPSERLERGQTYRPPVPTGRAHADGQLDDVGWSQFLATLPDEDTEGAMVQRLAWASPVNVGALLGVGEGPEWGVSLHRRLATLADLSPVRFGADPAAPRYPLALGHRRSVPTDTLLTRVAPDSRPSLPGPWLTALQRQRKRRRKKVGALERELAQAHETARVRADADLLMARLGEVRRGASEVSLEGFDGRSVTLELDPKLSPHENAQRRYRKAKKAEKAIHTLPTRIAGAVEALEELERKLERCRQGEWTDDDLRTLAEARIHPEPKRHAQPARGPFRTFTSSGGIPILVGRGARHNDELTFRIARPKDVWLHARDASGAHVVLRWDADDAPPARDLEEAAALAALHSGARHSGVVPVDWTRRRYVRKPRKAPAGTVVPERVKTVFVEPDPALIERLSG